jgi:hypothetical protein
MVSNKDVNREPLEIWTVLFGAVHFLLRIVLHGMEPEPADFEAEALGLSIVVFCPAFTFQQRDGNNTLESCHRASLWWLKARDMARRVCILTGGVSGHLPELLDVSWDRPAASSHEVTEPDVILVIDEIGTPPAPSDGCTVFLTDVALLSYASIGNKPRCRWGE